MAYKLLHCNIILLCVIAQKFKVFVIILANLNYYNTNTKAL